MRVPTGVSPRDFADALKKFEEAIGKEWVFTSDDDVNTYRDPYSPFWHESEEPIPSAAVAPDSVEQVQQIVRIAGAHKIPLWTISTGKNLGYGASAPLLTGTLGLNAALQIPPGTAPAHRRMTMKGSFVLDQAQFTNEGVKGRGRELSLRGQGRLGELKSPDPTDVAAHIEGNFEVARALIRFPALYFRVPGANIGLKGTYALDGGALDFIGNARMQVVLSKMVGGWKGFLLKAADPFFKNGSGADIPIHIGGTNRNPKIGLDFAARGATSPESPSRSRSK